jgi:hypothetical protein
MQVATSIFMLELQPGPHQIHVLLNFGLYYRRENESKPHYFSFLEPVRHQVDLAGRNRRQ